MKKTIVELFAGVGGFRLGFEKSSKDWNTVWASQWEPSKKIQHAFICYKKHFAEFGGVNEYSNMDISKVKSSDIPDHNLLVGGFPCQDYSVAGTKAKGIEGKKGVLWWDIKRIITDKKPPFILLENVDRLIKSPTNQRGRDFAVMLSCLNDLEYGVEWRVINAEDYGLQQRRRRVFIFAFHKTTKFYKQFIKCKDFTKKMFFAECCPISDIKDIKKIELSDSIIDISNNFKFHFENTGYMYGGKITTGKSTPNTLLYSKGITLSDIMEDNVSDEYYLTDELYKQFEYMKGSKKKERITPEGFKYNFSEGAIPFPDIIDRSARTILTSEASNNRSTHIVKDKSTGKLRKLTPIECERINGFPDNWTQTDMPNNFRYFCMGNALVVNLITILAGQMEKIFENE